MQYNKLSRFVGLFKSGIMRRSTQGITASAITLLTGVGVMNAQVNTENTAPLPDYTPIGIGAEALRANYPPQRPLHLYAGGGARGNDPVMRIGTGWAPTGNAQGMTNHVERNAAHIGLISGTGSGGALMSNNDPGAHPLRYTTLGMPGDFFISGGTQTFNPNTSQLMNLPVRNMIITNRSGHTAGSDGGNILFATTFIPLPVPDPNNPPPPPILGLPDREVMRITSTGLVGMGNTNPRELLHVGDMMTFGVGANENHISYNEWSAGTTRMRLNTFGNGSPVQDMPTMSITFDRMRGGFLMLGNAGRGDQSTPISYDEPLPNGNGYKGIVIGSEGSATMGNDKATIGLGNFPMPNTRVTIRGFRPINEVENVPPAAVSNALFVGRGDGIGFPILAAKDNGRVGIGTSGPRDILQLGSRFVFHAGGASNISHNTYYDATTGKTRLVESASVANHQRPAQIGFWDGNISLQVNNTPSGSANDEVTFDSKGLFINNNGNVGVGEMYPGARMVVRGADGIPVTQNVFEVRNSDNNILFGVNNNGIQANGNQGIGTSATATSRLTVRGNSTMADNTIVAEQHNGDPSLIIRNDGMLAIGTTPIADSRLTIRGTSASSGNILNLQQNNGNSALTVRNDGKVGIGGGSFTNVTSNTTTYGTENTKLQIWGDVQIGSTWNSAVITGMNNRFSIDGAVIAREVRVTTNDWADFVFKKSYSLPTLESVEQFISDNGHLPGIPSEQEVKENGVSLNDMQVKLLQKVEELTLYVIELKKQNERLEKQLQSTTPNTQR